MVQNVSEKAKEAGESLRKGKDLYFKTEERLLSEDNWRKSLVVLAVVDVLFILLAITMIF